MSKYQEGDIVTKTKGAKFWGCIVGTPYLTTPNGEWHYNVMAIHPDFYGTVHIMVDSQITRMTENSHDWGKLITATKTAIADPDLKLSTAVQLLYKWMEMHNVK